MVATLLLLCLALPSATALGAQAGSGSSLKFDEVAAKNRPVSKVVTLLKDMLKQLEKEAAEDKETYDKLACWCTTNDAEKTKAIADAEAHIDHLEHEIKAYTATSARLNEEIAALNAEVAKETKELEEATAMREKEVSEFTTEEQFSLSTITALASAIDTLSKHHGGASLLQVPRASMKDIVATLQRAMEARAPLLKSVLTHKSRKAIASFLQAPNINSYDSQSGEIFGVLSQMKETFEKDLAEAQAEETKSQQAYLALKAAKEAQIAAANTAIEQKSQELADTDEKNANAKVDLEDTTNSLSADEQFLMMLKEKCSLTDKEFEERTKTRQLEMEAVSKAMAVLSDDSAHDLFSRSLGFVQTGASQSSGLRQQAAKILSSVASKYRSPRLAQLAMSVRLDAFTKVKKAIDDMIAVLLQEKADEIKHKDFCTDELATNQLQDEQQTRVKMDLQAKIEDLQGIIKQLSEEIAMLKAEVADLQLELKRVSEDREQASREFQRTVADQRATQALLHKALDVLAEFYGKPGASAFAQQEPVGPPPPPGFKEYKNNAQSAGVMAEITQIIEDAQAMEKEAIKCEADAQNTYEAFVMETNASIEAKVAEIVRKTEEKGKREVELVDTQADLGTTMTTLEGLKAYNGDLHKACDFVLKNFDVRQEARDQEVEALKQAKAILSGANFNAFLQRSH